MNDRSSVAGTELSADPCRIARICRLWAVLAAAALALGACATTSLSPGPGAQTVPGLENVAVSEVSGVSVRVEPDDWQGDPLVERTVQPVRVTIDNDGPAPIRVRYGDFALIAPDGHRYAALPPFDIEGQLLSPVLADGYVPFYSPRFRYRGFYVAPYFARIYPGIPVYAGPASYFYDPFYYDFYYPDMLSAIRPTMEMLSLALPEGMIEPGGSITGFLYFERVSRNDPSVTFREELVAVGDAEGPTGAAGAAFGEVSIPFTVTTDGAVASRD